MTTTLTERKIIGANIRRLREQQLIGQTEAANKCNIERTYWIDIENGTANATFEKYERIARFFKVLVRDLLTAPPTNVTVFAQDSVLKEDKKPKRRKSA